MYQQVHLILASCPQDLLKTVSHAWYLEAARVMAQAVGAYWVAVADRAGILASDTRHPSGVGKSDADNLRASVEFVGLARGCLSATSCTAECRVRLRFLQ